MRGPVEFSFETCFWGIYFAQGIVFCLCHVTVLSLAIAVKSLLNQTAITIDDCVSKAGSSPTLELIGILEKFQVH